jgi:hypothetical protein
MLNNDPKRLRFLGIAMHSRVRRRIAVMATYTVAFVISVVISARVWDGLGHPYISLWVLAGVVTFGGIFRSGGLVKSFDVPKQRDGATRMVGSLDEWAQYRYGTPSFEESSAEQQRELLDAYRVGTYLVPQDKLKPRYGMPDEREAAERDRVSRRTLVWLASYLGYIAASFSVRSYRRVDSLDVVATLLTMMVLALTLPKAMVLWEEADPEVGELEVLPGGVGDGPGQVVR